MQHMVPMLHVEKKTMNGRNKYGNIRTNNNFQIRDMQETRAQKTDSFQFNEKFHGPTMYIKITAQSQLEPMFFGQHRSEEYQQLYQGKKDNHNGLLESTGGLSMTWEQKTNFTRRLEGALIFGISNQQVECDTASIKCENSRS